MNRSVAVSLIHPRDFVAMLRPHQWVKNLPLLAPLFLAGRDADAHFWIVAAIAFVAFCFTASGGYYMNDALDSRHDKASPAKRRNPVAAGRVPVTTAVAIGSLLIIAGFSCALSVNLATATVVAAYALGSLGYSAWLKRLFVIDCIVLAGLFTLRLAAGAAAISVPLSIWLACFSVPLFLSLALMKRCAQIDGVLPDMRLAGRNYHAEDRPLVLSLALASALLAIIVLVAYVFLHGYDAGLYRQPAWLWGFPLAVSLFLVRIAKVLGEKRLDVDPVAFALRDTISLAAGAGLALSFLLARG